MFERKDVSTPININNSSIGEASLHFSELGFLHRSSTIFVLKQTQAMPCVHNLSSVFNVDLMTTCKHEDCDLSDTVSYIRTMR